MGWEPPGSAPGALEALRAALGALGWEPEAAAGMAGALGAAGSAAEAAGLAEFAEEGPARAAVEAWLAGRAPAAPPPRRAAAAGAGSGGGAGAGARGGAGDREPPAAKGPTKAGGRRKYVPVDLAGGDERLDLAAGRHACECQATRHRLVGNCVACGRVVCKQEGPGPCLFCGAPVGVGSGEGGDGRGDCGGGGGPGGGSREATTAAAAGDSVPSEAERKAVAFKETLLTYDREASKRTTVIDDQSDFFEIESNAWLSKEEKGELIQRQRVLEEAEERRRKDFRVTIDLVGKQVTAAPREEEGGEGTRLAFVTREARGEAPAAGGAGAAASRPSPSPGARGGGGGGESASGARPAPLQDGPGQLAAGMMPNPGLVGKAPSYVSKVKGRQGKKGRRKKGGGRQGAQDESSAVEPPRRPREPEHRRVQDDEPF